MKEDVEQFFQHAQSYTLDGIDFDYHKTFNKEPVGLTPHGSILPFSEEASLLFAPSDPPSFAFAAIRGGFSSLSLGTLYGMRVIRLAYPAAALSKYLRSLS